MSEQLFHPFAPIYNSESRILILGSFPSVASRVREFYYGHPRNRFWPLLAALLKIQEPHSVEEKKTMLLRHRIALYDAVTSCTVVNSEDARMQAVIPSDLSGIFRTATIQAVFTKIRICSTLRRAQAGNFRRNMQRLRKFPPLKPTCSRLFLLTITIPSRRQNLKKFRSGSSIRAALTRL